MGMVRTSRLIVGLVIAALGAVSPAVAQQLQIQHIDVAQGDSTPIISPTGKTMLIDAGDQSWGDGAVLPYLRHLGVDRLDYVVVSHYDRDHIGGLDEVINGLGLKKIGVVYDRGPLPPSPATGLFRAYAAAANGERGAVKLGQWRRRDQGGVCRQRHRQADRPDQLRVADNRRHGGLHR